VSDIFGVERMDYVDLNSRGQSYSKDKGDRDDMKLGGRVE
jgi:hypothetical protein